MAKVLLGLDIGTSTIKATQLSHEKNSTTLLSAGYIASPSFDMASTNLNEEQVLGKSIFRLIHDMKVSTEMVVLSLPSTKVVTRVLEVPLMNEKELESSIQWEIEPYIPLPMDKVKMDWAVISENQETKKMKFILVAAPIALIEKHIRIVTIAGLTPISIETEMMAVARSVDASFSKTANILIVNIGATTTDIGLLHDGKLIFTKSSPIGGNTLTRAISEELGFEMIQAEEYKKTYGLEEDKLEGKIAKILSPFFTATISEMEKTVAYFKEQYPREDIASVVLSGGTAKLPGFVLTVTKKLGIDCQVNNPFVNLAVDPNVLPIIYPDAAQYTTSVGLAMKTV